MKLICCPKCHDLINLLASKHRTCDCGNICGKYLDDFITAVVSKNAIVVGIDNNGFKISKDFYNLHQNWKDRIDIFFTGWIPNHPGEVIVVDTVDDVIEYPFEMEEEDQQTTSTLPTRGL